MRARHFSLTELVACQLGSLPGPLAAALEGHVQSGCPACEKASAFAQELVEVARRDREATPPPALLARARSLFRSIRVPLPAGRLGLAQMAGLVFDSYLQPLPAGVRGALRTDRHMVFSAPELVIDMRIEPAQDADCQSLIGQVQSRTIGSEQFIGLPVLLLEQERVVMDTRTNEHGEFLFNMAPRQEMNVCLVCWDREVHIPCPPAASA